jgi:hypothetical protein
MKKIEQMTDVDFVWEKKIDKEPTTLIMYFQNEQGFASFIAGASVIGDELPICTILSKLLQVDAINTIPAPVPPEWKLYETYNEDNRRYLVLRITSAYIPSAKQTKAWLYNYPVLRDIIINLTQKGVDELVYITSNVMQENPFKQQPQIPNHELLIYDYDDKDDSLFLTNGDSIDMMDLDVPPTTWIASHAFQHFCKNKIRGNWIVMSGQNSATWINEEEAEVLLTYLEDTHALLPNQNYKAMLMEMLYDAEVVL